MSSVAQTRDYFGYTFKHDGVWDFYIRDKATDELFLSKPTHDPLHTESDALEEMGDYMEVIQEQYDRRRAVEAPEKAAHKAAKLQLGLIWQ